MEISAKDIGIKATAESSDSQAESAFVQEWLKELGDAGKREKDWRRASRQIISLYEGEKKNEYQFNILYSNTETMLPALYNSLPRPLVNRRFKSEDPLGKLSAKATERTLEYLIDSGDPDYSEFDELMKSATLEALLPGRGLTRFKYDALVEEQQAVAEVEAEEKEESDDSNSTRDDDATTPKLGNSPPPVLSEVAYETVCGEEIPWDRFLHGSAKKWRDVPWGAIQHFMTREELVANFGEVGHEIEVVAMSDEHDTAADEGQGNNRKELKGLKVAEVFEIWNKLLKEVVFISPQWKKAPLKRVSDPLKLSGFFPWPRPLSFIAKVGTLVPVPLYTQYEAQAKELNLITTRINKIVGALKVRGFYDSTVENLDKVLSAADNTLIAAENVAGLLGQGNSLDKAIFLMPIEKLVTVLQQLYVQREQIKTVIYELTGIADIMRGSSAASETLGAQQIKNQWGTMRLKKTQKEVQRYARDCLRIMAEIAMTKFSEDTLKAITGLPYPTGEEKRQAQEQLAAVQAQEQALAMQYQLSGQQPPPPAEPPAELQQVLSQPSWEELLNMLRDDLQRNYRIDIETNSTVDAEATEDKEDLGELMNAISQFLNGIGPLVTDGTMPFEVAQGMLLEVVRRYRFGSDMEDAIKKMQPPQQGAKPEEVKAQQAELQKQQQALAEQGKQFEAQQAAALKEIEDGRRNLQLAEQSFEQEKKQAEAELAMEAKFKLREIALAQKEADAENEMKAAMRELKLNAKAQANALKAQAASKTPTD